MNYLIIATILFSLSFGLISSTLVGVPSGVVAFLRLSCASLVFLPFFKKFDKKTLITALLIGGLQFGLMYLCFIQAFQYLHGNEIALLTTSTPLLVGICLCFFGEKFNFHYIICIALAILGAFIIVFTKGNFHFVLKGIIFMELSNFSFALGQVLWKKYIKENSINLMGVAYFGGVLLTFPLSVFEFIKTDFSFGYPELFAILYLGIIPTGLGFWLWNRGCKMVNGSILAIMNNLKIPLGVLFSIIIFHEKINLERFLLGSLFILAAIVYSHIIFIKATK